MITIKEQVFHYFKQNPTISLVFVKLQDILKIDSYEIPVLKKSIQELVNADVLRMNKNKKIYLNPYEKHFLGKIYTNYKGYGFLVIENHEEEDVFIPSSKLKNALHQDIVIARLTKNAQLKQRGEGEVVDIVKRDLETVVGTFIFNEEKSFGFVIPDNKKITKDIYIPENKIKGAKSYDKVVCQIEKYPEKNRNPEGKITEVIGVQWDKGVEAISIVKDNGIRNEFSSKLLKSLDKLSDKLTEEDYKNRLDLRNEIIFTIDGKDSKDLDDAISIDVFENGHYYLGVHIADVSHYVREGTKLDDEAFERATSVYLINQVIPMLPKKLSNGLCSLNPGEDKLTLSVYMEIDNNGAVLSHEIHESVITSRAKLNYDEVTSFIEGNNPAFYERYPEISDKISIMVELMTILRKRRDRRGALEFEFPESKIILDDNDKPIEIMAYPRGISNELIQEFMLVCNETVAETFFKKEMPFVYRVHENPREEKLIEFFRFANKFGYSTPANLDEINPIDLQNIMNQAKNKPEEQALNLLMLQSMQQARYHSVNDGHFGLASEYYCHFTSPIRRYPDLQIHRIIKDYLHKKINQKTDLNYLIERVELVSKNSSKKSRIAERAEKEYDELKKVEYMKDHFNEAFEGIIIKINERGLTVFLDNTIEGFISIDKVGINCFYTDGDYSLTCDSMVYKLGDRIVVQVDKIDSIQKRIDFKLPHFEEVE